MPPVGDYSTIPVCSSSDSPGSTPADRRSSGSLATTPPSSRVASIRVSRTGPDWSGLRSANLAEDFERLKRRPVSVFEHMSEEAVEGGFARIESALPSLGDGPQYETRALLVFQR